MTFKEKIFSIHTYTYALLPMLFIFSSSVRAGLLMSLFGFVLIIISSPFIHFKRDFLNKNYSPFLLYTIFLFSIFICFFSDLGKQIIFSEPSILFKSISYLFVPMFTAHILTLNIDNKFILKIIFKSILLSLFVSFLFHFIRPQFYIDFLEVNIFNDFEVKIVDFIPRFFGIYGNSMIIGCLSSLSVIFCLYNVGEFSKKNNRIALFFSIFCVLISMQRGAWLITLFSIVMFLYFERRFKLIFITLAIVSISVFLLFTYLQFALGDNELASYLIQRFSTLNDAVGERNHQWEFAMNNFLQNPFGVGLGSFGHKAVSLHGDNAATDGNFWRILVEFGFLGIIAYVILIVSSLYNFFKKKSFLLFQLMVVFLLLSVGTNVMDLYFSAYIFYILLMMRVNI